ncbi:pectate lyase [Fusarium sporotrichioides]|uniref:Pectate lyase n=1 Tax=Fusarium sporotrichioides TaxID=5514 RepID=A0A395S7X9_FUSSP|nr:pectate lyase [Fusarium sporotrichioides]
MYFTQALAPLAFATAALGQSLNIPNRVGVIQVLEGPRTLSGPNNDFGNQEFELNRPCDTDEDLGSDGAVFILNDGAVLSNVIIGVNQLEGVHCKGKCTLKNVWFRDVCEGKKQKISCTILSLTNVDAISILGNGDALIEGGGAQEAKDKVIQHNGRGTVTIKGFTVINAGKLYRGCGDCTGNGGPRHVVVENVKAKGVGNLVGINSNYGDTANISGTCGADVKKVCQEFEGVQKGNGKSTEVDTTASCKGQQTLSSC